VRALAEQSAARAGMTVTAWLERAVREQAGLETGGRPETDAATDAGPTAEHEAVATAEQDRQLATLLDYLPTPIPSPSRIRLDTIVPNPFQADTADYPQPNQAFIDRIRARGMATPIVIRPTNRDNARYEVVAGLAHYLAAGTLGWSDIPAVVMALSERDTIKVILLDALMAATPGPIEEAESYRWLLEAGAVTEDDLTRVTGRGRDDIRRRVALLDLPKPVQDRIDAGALSAEHGQNLADATFAAGLAEITVAHGLSPLQTHALADLTNRLVGENADVEGIAKGIGKVIGQEVMIRTNDGGRAVVISASPPSGPVHRLVAHHPGDEPASHGD